MLSKKKINGWAAVALVFLVCAVVYGLLSSYPRELAVYSDELRYLDVARSLLQGRGLRVRNMPSDYQKILYPLCILPALLLRTTAAQITAIGWLNAVYMASAVFPAYALARAMRLNPRRTAFLVGVTAGLPTMSAAATFMSETVFLPLSLWQVYFFLRAMLAAPRARVGWCAAAGAFCYLLYLNKEVALYYLIAWVLVRGWVWWHDKAGWRAELACNAALLGSFLACFVLAKVTLFRGLGNSYNQTGWLTGEQWRFLPFALVCDALFTVLAFWVYPVLLPLCGLHRPRRGSDARRTQLPLFLLLCLGIGVAVIAWSITVREDLHDPSPRQHMRYLEPLLIPLLAVTMNTLDEALTPARKRLLAALTALWGIGFIVVCRAIGAGAGDNTLLQWFDFVADRTDRLPGGSQTLWLAVWRVCIVLGVAVLGVVLVRHRGRRVLAAAALVLCAACYLGEWRINRWTYAIPAESAAGASALNESLAALDGKVLFLPCGVRQRDSQLIETYVARDVYIVEYETLLQSGALADGVLDLTAEAIGPEYPGHPYTDLTAAPAHYDMVFITNPTSLHAEALRQVKGRGEALFIEKPIFSAEQTGLALDELLPAGQKAYVAAPMRWCGAMLALKDRLPALHPYCARVICSSYLPDWRPGVDYRTVYSARKALGGGVTIDLIHEWDYLVELFGVPEKLYNFKGTYSELEIDSDDLSVYIAKYPTLLAEVHLDYFGRGYRRSIELFCRDGSYLADFGKGTLTLPDGTVQHYEEDVNRRYEREMEYFVDYALTGCGESCNPPALALKVLKLTLGENVQ